MGYRLLSIQGVGFRVTTLGHISYTPPSFIPPFEPFDVFIRDQIEILLRQKKTYVCGLGMFRLQGQNTQESSGKEDGT